MTKHFQTVLVYAALIGLGFACVKTLIYAVDKQAAAQESAVPDYCRAHPSECDVPRITNH